MWRSWFGQGAAAGKGAASRPVARAADQLAFLLNYGLLAPAHGVPWVMHPRGDAVDLILHHHCGLPLRDGAHRDLIVGCGAAVAQLRLAVRQLGYHESTILTPDDAHPQLLARVYLEDQGPAAPEAYVLYQALRGPLLFAEDDGNPRVDDSLLVELEAVSQQERARLVFLDEDQPPVHAGAGEIACDAVTLEQIVPKLHPFQMHHFDADRSSWQLPADVAMRKFASAMVATEGNEVRDWLAAGQAMARVLLRARVDGVHARVRSLVSPSFHAQVATYGARLRLGRLVPQLGIELGFPYAPQLPAPPAAPQLGAGSTRSAAYSG